MGDGPTEDRADGISIMVNWSSVVVQQCGCD